MPFIDQYLISTYTALLSILGDEIYPDSPSMIIVTHFLLIFGALINANIFGTIVVLV
jgi:hypothetical protein